jgi:hypothetical protein
LSRFAVAVILTICLVCPLVEIFDHWDHTIQTGQDVEYTLVLLALCMGATYSFARFILTCSLSGFTAGVFLNSGLRKSFLSATSWFTVLLPGPTSPPTLALRI